MALNIAIIGQGVSGTSTALAILEIHPSMKITLFADRPFEDTCSYGPGGHFEVMEAEHKFVLFLKTFLIICFWDNF